MVTAWKAVGGVTHTQVQILSLPPDFSSALVVPKFFNRVGRLSVKNDITKVREPTPSGNIMNIATDNNCFSEEQCKEILRLDSTATFSEDFNMVTTLLDYAVIDEILTYGV